jgi:murein DD-endopeptidase MepM/ murein hydrolase activator NlpD
VNHRKQWSLIVVRGDGTRLGSLLVTRRLGRVVAAGLVVGLGGLGAVVGDWWSLRQAYQGAAVLREQIAQQQEVIEAFRGGLADVRGEIAEWHTLHARILEPFGPERGTRRRETGIGGRTAETVERPAPRTPAEELELLNDLVREEGERLRALDQLIGRARNALAVLPSRWPVRGPVSSEFGKRRSPWTRAQEFHAGMDIAVGVGTPVRAPAAGTVAHAGPLGDYGIALILDHGDNLRTLYAHLSRVRVKAGQEVKRGADIALTGNTGRSSGPHLHYEVYVRGKPVNPRTFLWD